MGVFALSLEKSWRLRRKGAVGVFCAERRTGSWGVPKCIFGYFLYTQKVTIKVEKFKRKTFKVVSLIFFWSNAKNEQIKGLAWNNEPKDFVRIHIIISFSHSRTLGKFDKAYLS